MKWLYTRSLKVDLCESPPEIVKNDVIQVSPMESTLITDVRIDHPTSIPVTGVADSRKTQCSDEVPPIRFDSNTQEVPDVIAEPEPEKLTVGISLPAADHVGSARCTGGSKILYSDIATPTSVRALAVDNEDIQRSLNLGAIFSFHVVERDEEEIFPVSSGVTTGSSNDGTTKHGASSHTVARDTTQVMTDETFPVYDDDDVADALSRNRNEFLPMPDEEPTDQLSTGKEECFQLGRGESSPTHEDRKENSEEQTYFHSVRFPCHDASKDVPLSTESRLSSSRQQEAASSHGERCAARRPTERIRTTLSPANEPTRYQHPRMRRFNREFEYETRG